MHLSGSKDRLKKVSEERNISEIPRQVKFLHFSLLIPS
jgi:hypothetical protein